MVDMKMRLYYRADKGAQLGELRGMLEELAARGVRLEMVETSALSDEALMKAYIEAVMPSVVRKYRVRQVFGSKRHPGRFFGKEVPALVIYDEKGHPIDIYPHEENGQVIPIKAFLEGFLRRFAEPSEALRAAARMDERRARIGPIGIKASELIREGRRR